MKKIIFVFIIFVMLIMIIYYYFETKTTEVMLLGKVVGFEIENLDLNLNETSKTNTIKTSSKSVGTITFIEEKTNRFAALGHAVSTDKDEIKIIGNCYDIYFEYVKKGTKDREARIIADINDENILGHIDKSNKYGLFGVFEDNTKLDYKKIETMNRFDIKKGKAHIVINLDGTGLKEYEVEITEIDYLASNQNIRITVKSNELIKIAGGIAQGMSGAPLIQNGKIIGAINSVNSNNPLDAYAIFIDKLI